MKRSRWQTDGKTAPPPHNQTMYFVTQSNITWTSRTATHTPTRTFHLGNTTDKKMKHVHTDGKHCPRDATNSCRQHTAKWRTPTRSWHSKHDDVPDSSNNIMLTTNQPSESQLGARPEPHHIMHVPSRKNVGFRADTHGSNQENINHTPECGKLGRESASRWRRRALARQE